VLTLNALTATPNRASIFAARPAFWAWNLGAALHALALWFAGALEALHAGILFGPSRATDALYFVRLASGALMLAASVYWFRAVWRDRLCAAHESSGADRLKETT
jgi:hypothetical protein